MKKFLIIIFVMFFSINAMAVEFPADRPAKVGHRGARALDDENTLESLQLAVDLGVDMLEFDIQRTKDGVFVLMHDVTVDRTTDGTGRVDEMTLEEFKKLKTSKGHTPPTLDETLDWLETQDIAFILDFKIVQPKRAKDLIKQVEEHGLLERAIFESPDPKVAGMIEEIRPDITTSTYPVKMFLMSYYIKKYGIDIPSYYYPFANPIEVAYMKSIDKDIMVWTVNKKGWIKWFTKLGVSGIMTDDPNLFKE